MAALNPDSPRRCTGTAKSTGERCRNPAIPGGTVCRIHGGKAPQVQAAAERRLVRAELEGGEFASLLAELEVEVAGRDPVEHLERALVLTAAMSEVWRLHAVRLADVAEPTVIDLERMGVADERYAHWLNLQARLAEMAIRAGFEERRIRVVEAHAQLLAAVLNGSVAELIALVREQHPAGLPAFVEAKLIEAIPTILDHQLEIADGAGDDT